MPNGQNEPSAAATLWHKTMVEESIPRRPPVTPIQTPKRWFRATPVLQCAFASRSFSPAGR
jgi:hypothetical protein